MTCCVAAIGVPSASTLCWVSTGVPVPSGLLKTSTFPNHAASVIHLNSTWTLGVTRIEGPPVNCAAHASLARSSSRPAAASAASRLRIRNRLSDASRDTENGSFMATFLSGLAALCFAAQALEGSVRRDADKVRISAQLIQVKDQTHLWA